MLQKQGIDISFAQGLDTKTDPKRVAMGNFVSLENTVFNKGGQLTKRNGYAQLTSLPDNSYTYLTTLNDNLTAVGTSIAAYNSSNAQWVKKGTIYPMSISTLPIIRNNFNQTACDSTVASNGLVCTVYLENNGSTTANKYVIANSLTGQNIVAPAIIPVTSGTVSGGMRVFILGNNFIIVFTNTIGGVQHLQYIAIGINNPAVYSANANIASSYIGASTVAWDGYVVDNNLFVAYNTTSGGQSVAVTALNKSLNPVATPVVYSGYTATMMTVTADETNATNPVIYLSFYNSGSSTGYTAAINRTLNTLLAPVQIISSGTVVNIVSAAQNGSVSVFYEVQNYYAFMSSSDPSAPTNYINSVNVTIGGIVGSTITSVRSVGLASKAFIINSVIYFLSAFQSPYQPTYFLIDGSLSTEASPVITAKLAYENGGGYLLTGLPSVTVANTTAQIAYLYKDLISAVNKGTAVAAGTQVAGIYSQTGINLASFDIGTQMLDTSEIASVLHLSGGFLWMYDGYLPVEHNFFLWPDTDLATPTDTAAWSASGGSMVAQPSGWVMGVPSYYYQFTYEWTDNQGNAYRSAPSIPTAVTTTGSGTTGSVTLNIPTLRLTYKIANPVKIVIYRWSVAQQIYYQTTSISVPLLNSTTVDYVTYVDTNSDATILGNNILYTTGGVVEDVNAPASNILTLFDTRLWLVDAEDPNLLWFSKQVIEATPVEMSDLFTFYIAPTTAAQGSTGPMTALAPMDDKLIIFKANAIYYINGTGPDNTGSNNNYSQAIFITSTVGCANQQSIVFMPQGLMFQSDKGIWLLDRGLGTTYIGAAVEQYNAGIVESAQNIPETNQVRFILSTGITLMYDYYYGQWGTFVNVPAISSTIYNNMHTFINSLGEVYQENPGSYLDGSRAVLMQFQTGPLRLSQLQAYQRAYFFYLLGTYYSPHKLWVSVYYDYSVSPAQSTILLPNNFSPALGTGPSSSPLGQGTPFGGPSPLEDFRVFLQRQRCQAISIACQEVYDSTFGVVAGEGLTLSGLNMVLGYKKGYKPKAASQSFG